MKKLNSLTWEQRGQKEALEKKLADQSRRLEKLAEAVTRSEFEAHLADIMCCTWYDFANIEQDDKTAQIDAVREYLKEHYPHLSAEELDSIDVGDNGDVIFGSAYYEIKTGIRLQGY
jgi:hypothetical protein